MEKLRLLLTVGLLLLAAGCGSPASAVAPQRPPAGQTVKPVRTVKATPRGTTAQQLAALQHRLQKRLPGVVFPAYTPFSDEQTLRVHASGGVSDYTLQFTTAEHHGLAPLVLNKTTPTSTTAVAQANAALGYRPLTPGLTPVALSADLKASLVQTAGQVVLTWHQGNYSLTVKTAAGLDATKRLAQDISNFIRNNTLPRANRGAIVINTTTTGRVNTVKWRAASAYYTITGSNPMQTLRLAFGIGAASA